LWDDVPRREGHEMTLGTIALLIIFAIVVLLVVGVLYARSQDQ